MKKILILCINLLLLIIPDADPLKLIAGDRSVVKKDGATHTISKYYVVPNDYDPNHVTDTTAAAEKASSLRISSKSIDFGSIDKEISENKATKENHQSEDDVNDAEVTVEKITDQVNFRTDLNVGQGEVTNQHDDSTESTVSMSSEQTLDSDVLGNLQVVPIINPTNISLIVTGDKTDTNGNSSKALQNESAFIVDDVTDYQNIEDAVDELILSKFGVAVRDIYSQNLESFWKLIKIYVDKELDDDELLATIEQLSLLLNIFTNLYEAAQKQQPVGKMIDSIVKILLKPIVEKSNIDESQAETNISGDYNEECLRKCVGQLDSNSTYLSETEASDSLELENLRTRQIGNSEDNDLIKMSDDPDSNQVTVSNDPKNDVQSQLPVPYDLNVGVPDGYNVLYSMTKPTLSDVALYNDIQEDPNSIQNIPESAETVKSLVDQPGTVKSRTTDDLPLTTEDKTIEYFPWPIATTPNDGLPWHIEDKINGYYPSNFEHTTYNKVPWDTESSVTTLYPSSYPTVTTDGVNILLNPNQSIKSTLHSVKNAIKKPYHVYTYVVNPTATVHKVPNAGNVVPVVSREPYENLKTTLNDVSRFSDPPTLHDGNKVVYKNQPLQSHYESQYSLSKPTNDISRQHQQVTHHVTTAYDQSHEVNPSTLHLQTPQEDNEPQYLVGSEPNHKPALLQSNTPPSEFQRNSGEEKAAPTVLKIDPPPGDLLMNIQPNTFKTLLNLDNTGPAPTNVNTDIDNRSTNPNSYYSYDNGNQASAHSSVQTSQNPGLISASAFSSTYTNGPDEPVYGGQVYQQPAVISTASANSKYTTVQNDNDVPTQVDGGDTNNYPVYGGQVYQQPAVMSTASANSKYTTVQNDNDVPTQVDGGDTNNYPGYIDEHVYGGQLYQQPGAISTASANSKYTIVQNYKDVPTQVDEGDTNNYPGYIDNPVYGGQVYQQPGAISTASANSKYTIVQNYKDVPTQVDEGDTNNYPGYIDNPVYGGQVYQQPGAISTASANSKYTIVQNYKDVPTQVDEGDTNNYPGYIDNPVYGGQVYQQPSAISTASANSKYTIVQNYKDVPTQVEEGDTNNYPGYIDNPVYGGQVYQQPGAISTASANSKYTIVQNYKDVPTQVDEGDTNNYPGYIDNPVYGGQVYQQPGAISTASANSKYTIVQNYKDVPTQVDEGDTNYYPGYIDEPVYGGQVYQQPGAISTASANSKYTIVQNNRDVPTQVDGGDTNNYPGYIDEHVYGGQLYQQPGAISTASANSKYTIVQNNRDVPTQVDGGDTNNYPGYIDNPVYGGQVYQQPSAISTASAYSKYTTVHNGNDVPTQVYGEDTNNYPGYISKATAHSEYTNVPIDYGHGTNTQPGLISEFHQYPNVVDDFDDSNPVNGIQIQKHPGHISKASAHQNVPIYPEYTDGVNHYIKVNGGPTQKGDNYLVPYQPYGHTVHVIHKPSHIKTISGNQNLKLAPTYRLFTQQNLQNLKNAIIKIIKMHGPGFYDDRVLIKLKNIINVILLLAENLEETDGNNAWYEKIFYNSGHSQHPLQHYVYKLIRQRWLHELMLVLNKNHFNIKILQKPGIFSFLESWQIPEYVQNFIEAEELMHVPKTQNYNEISNNQNAQHKFAVHTYDDFLNVPVDLAEYVTKKVINSYKTPNAGIVLSIAGVEAEPDARAIISILQNYLHYKKNIDTQENVIIRDKKVEMLKRIILFLREKGYGPNTIADLIRKLYTAVYLTKGKDCNNQQTNFAKNIYDVIVPVLKRSVL